MQQACTYYVWVQGLSSPICAGAGAYAFENVRTSVEHGCRHVGLPERRALEKSQKRGLDYFRLTFPTLCGFCSGQDVQYVQLYWSSIYCWLLGNLRQDQTRHSCIQHPQLARDLCPQPLHETAYQWICVWYASLAAFILIQCLHLRCQKWQILQCGQVAEIHDRICSKLPKRKWMECMGNKILHICIQMSQNL